MTYSILNILGDLINLQNVCIYLAIESLVDTEGPVVPDSACWNLDLCGVLELLPKARKLRKVVIKGVVSPGNHIPSAYLKKILAEQQQNNLQLLKYIVIPTYHKRLVDTENLFGSEI